MAMSRKDYVAVAKVIRSAKKECIYGPKYVTEPPVEYYDMTLFEDLVIKGLADVFADDNPRFDYARFAEACSQ